MVSKDSPADGAQGRILGGQFTETGVTVNGYPAQVNGGRFFVNALPLVEGENTITVNATGANGNTASATTTIYYTPYIGQEGIELYVNPESGIAPLEATLRADLSLPFVPTASNLGYEGPAEITITPVSATEYGLVFNTPGLYTLTYEVHDDQGNPYAGQIMVNVLDRQELDALLQEKWSYMKQAMIAGDIETAIGYFTYGQRDTFRQIYTIAQDKLAEIALNMRGIELIYQINDTAEYRIYKDIIFNDQPETVAFYIYFQREADGIWRIRDF